MEVGAVPDAAAAARGADSTGVSMRAKKARLRSTSAASRRSTSDQASIATIVAPTLMKIAQAPNSKVIHSASRSPRPGR